MQQYVLYALPDEIARNLLLDPADNLKLQCYRYGQHLGLKPLPTTIVLTLRDIFCVGLL
jgi:hypothetical protein